MPDCIFCKIINKEIPSHIIYEDKKLVCFLDINPVNQGHILLIPKKHYEMMEDVPDDLLSNLFITTKKLMVVLKKAMNAEYVILSVVGIDVPHFHIHLIPRYKKDGLANFWPTKKYSSEQEAKEIAAKIKTLL